MNPVANLICRSVRKRISEVVLAGEALSQREQAHMAACLLCQAEAAQYRQIERGFASLRQEVVSAPPDLVARVMRGLDRTPVPRFRKPIALGVSTASAVAVAATVAFALRRRHAAA